MQLSIHLHNYLLYISLCFSFFYFKTLDHLYNNMNKNSCHNKIQDDNKLHPSCQHLKAKPLNFHFIFIIRQFKPSKAQGKLVYVYVNRDLEKEPLLY